MICFAPIKNVQAYAENRLFKKPETANLPEDNEDTMEIKLINSIDQFNRMKQNWDDVYSADPHATIFTSWAWMRGWLETTLYGWHVLAFRPGTAQSYTAFMVLGMSSNGEFRFNFVHGNLHMGGNPITDHTGFVCLPDYADAAIPSFAEFIQKRMKWNTLSIMDVFDPRLDIFLQCFSQKRFHIMELEGAICPYIVLPDSWDRYLREFLSPDTRRKLKYKTGLVSRLNDYKVVYTREDNLEIQIDILLKFRQKRWGIASEQIDWYRALYRHCFEENALWLATLWVDNVPVAGIAGILDQKLKTFVLYMSAFNDEFAKYSPGRVMIGYSIRYAIENGFKIYDFGVGDEQHKYSFGAEERFNRNVVVSSNTLFINLKKKIPGTWKTFGKRLLSTTKRLSEKNQVNS